MEYSCLRQTQTTAIKKHNSENGNRCIAACIAAACALAQVFIINKYYFRAGWDVSYVENLVNCVLTQSNIPDYLSEYFSVYPNNLFLSFIWLCSKKLLGLFSVNELFCVIAVNIAFFQLSAFLLYDSIFTITCDCRYAYFGFFAYELLTGLSPWISIPYSDTMGLIFPVLTLWISLKKPERRSLIILKWFSIGLIAYAAYSIKPQASFMSIAVVLCSVYRIIGRKENIKSFFRILLPLATGILCSALLVNAAVSSLNIEIDENKSFGPAHFFMMGLNEDYTGTWNQDDVSFSASFENCTERTAADFDRAVSRIKDMGLSGLIKHLINKTVENYGDGAFAWWAEGNFVSEYFPEYEGLLYYITRNLFYESGSLHGIWKVYCRIIWLPVLFLSFFAISGKKTDGLQEIIMTLLGVFIFSLLFETRARYLVVNTPVFVAAATIGLKRIISLFRKHENPLGTA